MERERARAEERQGKVACGGSGFDGGGKRKKKRGSLSESDCTVRAEEEGFIQPTDEGKANYSLHLQ